MNNKGFAITSFLYGILIAFLLIFSILIINIINTRISLNALKNDTKDNIDEDIYDLQQNYAKIVIENQVVNITSNQQIDLLDGVYLQRYDGTVLDNEITYTSSPSFNNSEIGTYVINYFSTIDGVEYVNHKIIKVIRIIEYAFDYTGEEQTVKVPETGRYKLETWGAQGGSSTNNSSAIGGYGGYSTGVVYLEENDILYINVGGKGKDGTNDSTSKEGGYNGGGTKVSPDAPYYSASGGGATHIAKKSGLLSTLSSSVSDILIVSGGGGGGAGISGNYGSGGAGGGFKGSNGTNAKNNVGWGSGGSQTAAGCKVADSSLCGSFGLGNSTSNGHGGAGGGGYYGGGSTSYDNIGGGGGGSGYIGNALLTEKYMYCYNCEPSEEESTKTYTTINVDDVAISNYAKSENGYAKITYLGS